MRFQLLATVLACSAAFVSFGANASNPTPFDGGYVLEVLPNNTADHSKPSCVVFDPALGDAGIRAHRWGNSATALCGLGDLTAHGANKQAVWDITPVEHTDGRKAYTLRSRYNGKCLIRSNNGHNVVPSLHMWNATNPQWCGFGSADAVIENGQAAWVFGETPDGAPETQVSSIAAMRNGLAYLSFASTNTNMRGTQAMLAVDHVFRLSCMPETCMKPEHHQIVGSGPYAYSRAVRVIDAAYLDLPYTAWTPTEGFGDTREQYVAVLPKDAELYCTRLRTGGFSDWRLPTPDELKRITWPSNQNNNQLWTRFGWPTGELPYQTTLYRNTSTIGWAIAGEYLHGARGNWYSVNDPYPVSCVR
ncbi:DUF1566 domain-containing protein [Lysobacter sp. A6]|uniref:DUF1566 domain-containing protein n=1 Tax=Noviluteimonas lactosilytica TaxID=2888523 RepID=A0ABS8JKZ2_9GAMM|nr:DUF1566 domain-containing protein [Lysobacter lactosilyticus]MCC8364278.1 DUF1566 domain-containing protein [Lysobacter lactosilyticus]